MTHSCQRATICQVQPHPCYLMDAYGLSRDLATPIVHSKSAIHAVVHLYHVRHYSTRATFDTGEYGELARPIMICPSGYIRDARRQGRATVTHAIMPQHLMSRAGFAYRLLRLAALTAIAAVQSVPALPSLSCHRSTSTVPTWNVYILVSLLRLSVRIL